MLLVRGLSAASFALLPVENPSNHLRSFAYLSLKKGFSSGKSKSPRLNLHQFLHRHKTSFLSSCQVHINLNPVSGFRVYSEAAFHIQTDLLVEDNVTVSLHSLEKKRTRRNRKAASNIIEKEVDDTGQCVIEEENRLVPQRSKSSAQNSPGNGKTGKKSVKSGTKSLSNSCICAPGESKNVIAPLIELGINEAVDSPGKGKTSKKAVKSGTKSLSDAHVIELGINESVVVKKFTRKKINKPNPFCESDLGHCEAVSGAGDSLGIKESTPLATPKKIRVSKITKEVKDLKLAEGKTIVTSKKAKATRQKSNMQCSDVMQLLKTDAGLASESELAPHVSPGFASESELAPNVPQVNGKDSEETPTSSLFDVARCKEANVDLFQSLNSPTGGATTTIKSLQLDERSRKKAAEEFDGAANILPKKKKKYTPGSQLRWSLDQCSKNGDVLQALAIYDKTLSEGLLQLNQYHYNIILYLCASAALGSLLPAKSGKGRSGPTDGDCLGGSMAGLVGNNELGLSKDVMEMIQKRGFEVYEHMKMQGVSPNEATFTAVARLAVAKRDGGLAFQMVKETGSAGITTRLRSYGPALYVFYLNKEHEKAFEVDAHMVAHGVQPEESELEVLLHLSIDAGLNDKVYSLLHRLRATVRAVSPSTVALIEKWFSSEAAKNATGDDTLTIEGIRSAITSRGGGWHGLGWLGLGQWRACYTTLNKIGVCLNCGERLVTIDIDPQETEKFAESLATLASSREPTNNFKRFQEWVDRHGPYEAVVDGANVAMYNQNFAQAGFTFTQLNAVVTGLQHRSPSKNLPLIILHNRRVVGGPALSSHAQQLLQQWTREEALYTTPTGSNDDWYWLYAAVKYKCLLVTNDEMRDHLFQLLGNDFFPKWKERHQVRFNITHRGAAVFHMPPPYSIVIQESERGSWHIPKSGGDDITSPREWLCVTRPAT